MSDDLQAFDHGEDEGKLCCLLPRDAAHLCAQSLLTTCANRQVRRGDRNLTLHWDIVLSSQQEAAAFLPLRPPWVVRSHFWFGRTFINSNYGERIRRH